MSAICGIVNFDGKPVTEDEIRALMAPMASWGPDESSTWIEGNVGLGHLALRTTPASEYETLPFVDHTNGLAIAADAVIDNREELLLSHSMAGEVAPDSQLILGAYAKWGLTCLPRLLGDFAFAIWDRRESRLFIARDCCGMRPVFYARSRTTIVFASAVRALRTLPFVSCEPDELTIADYLLNLRNIKERTFYRDIERLPPAHALTVSEKGPTVWQHWAPGDRPVERFRSPQEHAEAVRETLTEAVRCRLRTTGTVGVAMSGGIDSGSVSCLAARQLRTKSKSLFAFSSVPLREFEPPLDARWTYDETPYIEAISRQERNIVVHYVRGEGRTPLSTIERELDIIDRPLPNVANGFWIISLLESARDNGVRVLLTGQCGNLSFSWHAPGYLAELVARRKWLRLAAEIWKRRASSRKAVLRSIAEAAMPHVPTAAWLWYRDLRSSRDPLTGHSLIRQEFARQCGARALCLAATHGHGWRDSPSPLQNWYRIFKPDRRESGDLWAALGQAHGFEVRDPTADRRLIDLCYRIPTEFYFQRGRGRALALRSMEGTLPHAVRWNTRPGLQAADVFCRMRGRWGQIAAALATLANHRAGAYLDLERAQEFVGRLEGGDTDFAVLRAVLQALSLSRFLDRLS
jgi:asparagine synthase (glutamine-hydrolysing)